MSDDALRRSASQPPTGVLLVNLGSPDEPTPRAVRRYLKEFLSDPLIVDWPRWLWIPILNGIILNTRPRQSAARYERVWTDAGSPLVEISRRQARALQQALGDTWRVECAMRYGNPPLQQGLARLRAANCESIVVLPLFPQECRATTGSVVKALEAAVKSMHAAPELHVVPTYATDEGYLEASVASVRETLDRHRDMDHVVFSFHGIPLTMTTSGDNYAVQCESTAIALAKRLQLTDGDWTLAYQSRFGPGAWLGPSAIDVVRELASAGQKRKLLVACPGFTTDCLETLDEIGTELRNTFIAAGGADLVLATCINDRAEWIDAMADLVQQSMRASANP